jgi:translation initiation factor IF-3
VARFLRNRDKVKITIMFRGREVTHPERGTALLERLAGELAELAVIEQAPSQDGRNMTMMLAPSKAVLAADKPETAGASADGNKPAERGRQDGRHARQRARSSQAQAEQAPAEVVEEPSAASADAA